MRTGRVPIALRGGAALLAFGAFLVVTHELYDREFDRFDGAVMLAAAALRRSWLNGPAVDVTALGSGTVLTLLTIVGVLLLLAVRQRICALQLLASSLGGGLLSRLTKHLVERPRPVIIPHLVEVAGYSYPSGHSLGSAATYLALIFIATRHFASSTSRAVVVTAGVVLIGAIALSRVYLGVHYPSDVLSGVLLGAGWALILEAASVAAALHSPARGVPG